MTAGKRMASVGQGYCGGGGVVGCVGNRDEDAGDASLGGDRGGVAGQCDGGAAEFVVADLHVGPGDFASPAGADGFEDGLFGGESAGDAGDGIAMGVAVGALSRGEDSVEESVFVPGHHVGDALAFDQVGPEAYDVHGPYASGAERRLQLGWARPVGRPVRAAWGWMGRLVGLI